jgi:hypothetical protein
MALFEKQLQQNIFIRKVKIKDIPTKFSNETNSSLHVETFPH